MARFFLIDCLRNVSVIVYFQVRGYDVWVQEEDAI